VGGTRLHKESGSIKRGAGSSHTGKPAEAPQAQGKRGGRRGQSERARFFHQGKHSLRAAGEGSKGDQVGTGGGYRPRKKRGGRQYQEKSSGKKRVAVRRSPT